MNLAMGVPLRVATATSNMMIGITAAASALIYAIHGGLDVVRRRADRDRRVHRRDGRVAARAPRRPALPAAAVRGGAGLHGDRDARCGSSDERHRPGRPGGRGGPCPRRRTAHRPAAHRRHLRLGRAAGDRRRPDDRRLDLARRRSARRSTSRPSPPSWSRSSRPPSCGSACWRSSPRRSGGSSWPAVAYARESDWPMVGISIAILAVIAIGVVSSLTITA